jgi:hypothetical protein
MVKNPDRNKEPIIMGYLSGHIWKRIWRALALTHVVGFLRPIQWVLLFTTQKNYYGNKK